MKFKQWLIALAVVLVLIVAGVGGYYYWTTTPQYALLQIKKAYATHDTDLALKYIDVDSIFDNVWTQVEANLAQETASSTGDSWSQLGTMMAEGMVENMKPALEAEVRSQIVDSVKTSTSTTNIAGLATHYSITRDGSDVLVKSDASPLELRLEKENTSYYRVVAIEGLNLDNGSADQ